MAIGSSGTLSFTDADANTLFALTPSFNLAAGATQNLLFEAHFDNTALGIPVGASLRAEILVTFGGAGARGGGNASASNMDVNGDGTPEADVRTVPTGLTKNLPALQACNDSVNV